MFPNLTIKFYSERGCGSGSRLRPEETLTLKQAHSSFYYDPGLQQRIQSSNRTHIFMHGFLQNIGYFVDYLQDIKKEFTLAHYQKQKSHLYLLKQLQTFKTSLKTKGQTSILRGTADIQFVGVHVRRADYLIIQGYKAPDSSYFKKAMNYFQTKYFGQVLFIVSTDDLNWCHKNIKGPNVIFTQDSGQKSREEDFSIQVSCNHSIISIGTFGWWIAFLSTGEVFFFKEWVKSTRAKWYLPGQRYPIDWKGL